MCTKRMKKITIFGSTGSVGKQTLDVIRAYPREFKVIGLACAGNTQELRKQIKEFKPERTCTASLEGEKALEELAAWQKSDMVVMAIAGAAAIRPTLAALKAGKRVALASKEVMVVAGEIVNKELKKLKLLKQIIPVDSEHSAIFQCLDGRRDKINKIILTCSGGPFLGKKRKDLEKVTIREVLAHPNWKMGPKITLDSATLLNKGLEVIEAMRLFNVSLERIKVIVHPQSIIHSMVEFEDGNILAQLGPADMRFAIRYALSYPKRLTNRFKALDFEEHPELTFAEPDTGTFHCLPLAYEAAKQGGTLPAVLNAASEAAALAFLERKIGFLKIAEILEKVMKQHKITKNPSLNQIFKADKWAREVVVRFIGP